RQVANTCRLMSTYCTGTAKEKLSPYFVWLSADRPKTEQYLETARKSLAIEAPVGISIDGREGPGALGLNRNVALTMLFVGKDSKVIANWTYVQTNETDVPKMIEVLAAQLETKAPTLEELRGPAPKTRPPENKDPEGVQENVKNKMRGLLK